MARSQRSSKQPAKAPAFPSWINVKTGKIDLGAAFPPLAKYWPNLATASAPQTAFLVLPDLEVLYGGSAGGGKSDALLAAALQYVDHPRYAALILRRTFAELALPEAIMATSKAWLTGSDARWNESAKTWTFPSGATVTFGFLERDDDVHRYQGSAYQFVGWDELTQFPERPYTYLFSRMRRLKESTVPIRMRAASNPGGVGHAWVLKRFPIAAGLTPADREGRVFIPAKVYDNPGLDADEYVTTLGHLDETLRKQLMDGDWGAFEGAAFQHFDETIHCVPPFTPLPAWERVEGMDFGMNNPTAWYLTLTDYDGNLVFADSFYKPGLPSETAPVIRRYRKPVSVGGRGWETRDRDGWGSRNVCYADPSIQSRTGGLTKWGAPATIETEFQENGIDLILGNNDPRVGYARLRELVKPDPHRRFPLWHPRAGEYGSPRLFVVKDTCPELVEQLKAAPLQGIDKRHAGEMIDPKWEGKYGHATAAARYIVSSRPAATPEPEAEEIDPRRRFLLELEEREQRDMERRVAGSRRRFIDV